jgi:hypothetical protein
MVSGMAATTAIRTATGMATQTATRMAPSMAYIINIQQSLIQKCIGFGPECVVAQNLRSAPRLTRSRELALEGRDHVTSGPPGARPRHACLPVRSGATATGRSHNRMCGHGRIPQPDAISRRSDETGCEDDGGSNGGGSKQRPTHGTTPPDGTRAGRPLIRRTGDDVRSASLVLTSGGAILWGRQFGSRDGFKKS